MVKMKAIKEAEEHGGGGGLANTFQCNSSREHKTPFLELTIH